VTITGYENRIREFTADRFIPISDGKVKTLAHRLAKRQARMLDEDLERIFTHADPTPVEAIRNIERESVGA
jgi:hypothetical protein